MRRETRRIEVRRTASRIECCNVCFGRNYEPGDGQLDFGHYTPDIFDINLGGMTGHLCRDCLSVLGLAALNVAIGGADHAEGPEH